MDTAFFEDLGLTDEGTYCQNCGKGDSDWCEDCEGCRYSQCDTCTCEHTYRVKVTYYVTVIASNEDSIDSDMLQSECECSYPDDWDVLERED